MDDYLIGIEMTDCGSVQWKGTTGREQYSVEDLFKPDCSNSDHTQQWR